MGKQWEKHVKSKAKTPKTMLPRDVRGAFAILYSDASSVEQELTYLQEHADMEFLDRNLTTRGARLSITREACGVYAI